MGQCAICCAGAGASCPGQDEPAACEGYEQDGSCEDVLSSIRLDFKDPCAVRAHEAMLLAVTEHRLGHYQAAGAALEEAQLQLKQGWVPPDLKKAYDTDPALQAVKEAIGSDFLAKTVLSTPARNSPAVFGKRRPEHPPLVEDAEGATGQATAEESLVTSPEGAGSLQSDDRPSAALAQLGHAADVIRQLCREARIFEAVDAVAAFERELASAVRLAETCRQDASRRNMLEVAERLMSDQQIAKLRSIFGRLEPYFRPDGLLVAAAGGRPDAWVADVRQDPEICEHFRIEVASRYLDDGEREKSGPVSQILVKISLVNWPQELEDLIALDRETDLAKKEFIEDCRLYEGQPGGPEQLMSSMLHYVIRPSLLPLFSIDFLQLREYAVCEQPRVPGYVPGVFVLEETPPSTEQVFEGWQLPASQGSIRILQKTIKHLASSAEHPHCSTQTIIMKAGLSIPKGFISLKLVNTIILTTTLKTFKNFKRDSVDRWGEQGVQERMANAGAFYQAVASVKAAPGKTMSEVKAASAIQSEPLAL